MFTYKVRVPIPKAAMDPGDGRVGFPHTNELKLLPWIGRSCDACIMADHDATARHFTPSY